jgi:hypothetical protein
MAMLRPDYKAGACRLVGEDEVNGRRDEERHPSRAVTCGLLGQNDLTGSSRDTRKWSGREEAETRLL